MAEKFILEVTLEQARLIARACEFYSRMRNGQYSELGFEYMMYKHDKAVSFDRDHFEQVLYAARPFVFPDMRYGVQQHYGVHHDQRSDEAWDIYESVRYALAWHEHPEGGDWVDFREPMNWSGNPLPKCRIEEDKECANTADTVPTCSTETSAGAAKKGKKSDTNGQNV